MTPNEARAAIILRILSVGSIPDDQIDFDNGETFNVPSTDVNIWARVSIRFNARNRVSIGGRAVNRKYTRVGIATIQVFTPVTNGEYLNDLTCAEYEAALTDLADDRPLYYGGVPSGGDIRIDTVGRDGAWYGQNVVIPFWVDECLDGA
ncbi:tail-completion protein [Vibrio phage 1.250.O._10N.261.55.E11]|nr:tail-completion protein [Vibrio phage 1.250.O._10N.261.55.E11]